LFHHDDKTLYMQDREKLIQDLVRKWGRPQEKKGLFIQKVDGLVFRRGQAVKKGKWGKQLRRRPSFE